MAVTAQAHGAPLFEPSAWTVRPASLGRHRRWPWAVAGIGGLGVLVAAIVAVTITLGASAVGGDTTQSGGIGGPSADLAAVGRHYASLVSMYANAERSWKARAGRIVPGSTSSAEALIRPTVQFADAVDLVDHDLPRLSWPAALRGDVEALEADLATVSGDLRSIGGQTVSSMSGWEAKVVADAAQSSTSTDRVMRRLEGTASGPGGPRPSPAEG